MNGEKREETVELHHEVVSSDNAILQAKNLVLLAHQLQESIGSTALHNTARGFVPDWTAQLGRVEHALALTWEDRGSAAFIFTSTRRVAFLSWGVLGDF